LRPFVVGYLTDRTSAQAIAFPYGLDGPIAGKVGCFEPGVSRPGDGRLGGRSSMAAGDS